MLEFQPIDTESKFELALEYVVVKSLELGKLVLGRNVSIDTICLFSHTPDELAFLKEAVLQRGDISRFSHGATTYVDSNFLVAGQHIKILGVREPDATRPEVGYSDYPVADFAELLKSLANNEHASILTSGLGQTLVELHHPDLDVRGYIVDASEHLDKK